MVLHGFARLLVEFLRVNKAVFPLMDPPAFVNIPNAEQNPEFLTQYYWHGFSQSQLVSIIIILVGAFFILKWKLWKKESISNV